VNKYDSTKVAELLRSLADKLEDETFYVSGNTFEFLDFETVKLETSVRENTGSLKQFLEEHINV